MGNKNKNWMELLDNIEDEIQKEGGYKPSYKKQGLYPGDDEDDD